jgi:hypothetical protein
MRRIVAFVTTVIATMLVVVTAFAEPGERELRVAGALVRVHQDEALVWNARWVLAAEEAEGDAEGVIRFAVPLPAGETLVARPDLVAVVEDGHIAGVRVDKRREGDRIVEATFVQPGHVAHGPLGVPLADGAAIQIVEADLGGGSRLEVDRDRALDRRVAHAAREEACRLTSYEPEASDTALYLRGADVRAARGLRGSIVTIGERSARMSAIAAAVFATIVGVLVVGWRRVRKASALERADAVLAHEIDTL